MRKLKMNPWAIIISLVWMFILGFLWYGPLFGETWMAMVGLDMATIEANPPDASIWVANIIGSILPLLVLAWLYMRMRVESAVSGAITGLLIGFGIFLAPTIVQGLFAQDPYGLAWVNGGFQLVGWTVSGLILGAWRKYE